MTSKITGVTKTDIKLVSHKMPHGLSTTVFGGIEISGLAGQQKKWKLG